jgi:hypothetical protein
LLSFLAKRGPPKAWAPPLSPFHDGSPFQHPKQPPQRQKNTKPSMPGIAHDVASWQIAPERMPKGYGQR